MGTLYNTEAYWNFVNIYPLEHLIDEITSIERIYKRYEDNIARGKERVGSEKENFRNILLHGLAWARQKIHEIIPEGNKRSKRGAFNFLGGIIKSISGNLDNEDAIRYDKAIQELIKNQDKLKEVSIKQISLVTKAIDKFEKTIKTIQNNQILLEKRLSRLEQEITRRSKLNILLNQMILLVNIINENLDIITNALTFARKGVYHPSIVPPDDLMNEMKNIKINEDLKLPVKPENDNLHAIESILKVKAFSKGSVITFIVRIPLVKKEFYHYYHVYPLPTQVNQTWFKQINPSKPYVAISDNSYVMMREKCQELQNNEFICEHNEERRINQDTACEIQLLSYSNHYESCMPELIEINEVKVEKLEFNRWILVLPKPMKIVKQCKNLKEFELLEGTALAEIQSNECNIKINEINLKIFENENTKVILPSLPELKEDMNRSRVYRKLEAGNKDEEIQGIQENFQDLQKEIEEINQVEFHERPITIYDILIIIILCLVAVSVALKYGRRKNKRKQPEKKTAPSSEEAKDESFV